MTHNSRRRTHDRRKPFYVRILFWGAVRFAYSIIERVTEMIYTTFKQWVKGCFLETGEPRKQAYSKDELALIEMGWNYGYDAGVQSQKSQQALDKKADNARELGLDYEPQRTWVGLTNAEIENCFDDEHLVHARNIERLLKEKNNG